MRHDAQTKRTMSLVLACALALGGCSNVALTESQKNILAGTAVGAASGAAIGALGGDAGLGAAAGAGAGFLGGFIYDLLRRSQSPD